MSSAAVAANGAPAKPAKSASPLLKAYLVTYNLVSCLSWLYVLFLSVRHLTSSSKPFATLYEEVERPLQFAQTLAVLELFHSLMGLVRSPFISALLQVGSRLFIVWGITYIAPVARHHPGFALAAISWGLVEVPRYLFYAASQVTTPPAWLTWLRYSLFAILYPSGITGEIWCVLRALPYFASHPSLLSVSMPNDWNVAFSYLHVCYFLLALYLPGSPFMFMHMVKQRSKVLGATKSKAA